MNQQFVFPIKNKKAVMINRLKLSTYKSVLLINVFKKLEKQHQACQLTSIDGTHFLESPLGSLNEILWYFLDALRLFLIEKNDLSK